ncbi:CHAT domain-containing protein [Actinoplanes ianthinogenes]|uniref:CHAT domain-containing protein n=1 Tax=Actinoplanes ianthinogenes TaxID=122358 RepID=A0ABN6CR29_9ACTN|nr:CHAT domain-containing protein [Actinoplanes ianthinogenes]BCJ47652.1 CHAT domain-containing protein [Actinoplanes ianthinogenes]GGR03197.1 CHAT domain-containing protein [Actinoplanes ianthinogenes]
MRTSRADELKSGLLEIISEAGDDPDALLGAEAFATVAELAEHAGQDVDAAYLLGAWHWLRGGLVGDGEREREVQAALIWWEGCFPQYVDELPTVLLPALTRLAPRVGDTPHHWNLEAGLLMESSAGGECRAVLDRAVALLHDAAREGPDPFVHRGDLCNALRLRFDRFGDRADIDEAIHVGTAALAEAPADFPARAGLLTNLGLALHARHERTGAAEDLDEALRLHRAAVAAEPGQPLPLSNLAGAVISRFHRTGARADLDEAIDLGRRAVSLAGPGDPDRSGFLSNVGGALRQRFEAFGDDADLEEAVRIHRWSLADVPDDHPDRRRRLECLAAAVQARFERYGDDADLDEFVGLARDCSPDLLASALVQRFERTGQSADLDEAVDLRREVLDALPDDHADRLDTRHNLAVAHYLRFSHTGDSADLDAAIALLHQVLAMPPERTQGRAWSQLCIALRARFERTTDPSDLDDAVTAGRRAIADSGGPAGLANLSAALWTRFEHRGEVADLDEALRHLRAAQETLPEDHPDRRLMLTNLATIGRTRYEAGRGDHFLSEAIDAAEAALTGLPDGHPDRGMYLGNLGLALRAHSGGRDRAIDTLREAALADGTAAALGTQLGHAWARLAAEAGRPDEAARAWATVFARLPELADHGLGRADRQHHLSLVSNLGAEAAVTALTLGDVEQAWAWLEQGRGVLLAQTLESRAGLGELRRVRPDLADRVVAARAVLDAEPVPDLATVRGRREVAGRWRGLLDEIRATPGFARFGLPPTIAQLRRAARGGTLVAVLASDEGCHALTMTERGAGTVALPALTYDEAIARANALRGAVDGEEPDTVREVLGWLWDTVTGPILRHLGHTATPGPGERWPRVWWMPTGPFGTLPLHAAGRETGVPDLVVSSYAPTARILDHAGRPDQGRHDGRVVAVGVNEAPGMPPLLHARREAEQVAAAELGGAATLLLDEQATREAVRAWLPRARWAHLACHAATATDPAQGHLALHDGPLSARELTGLDLSGGFLAYLSACTTADGGVRVPDESIHIASALQLAGFTHVIGTLWPVRDAIARRFSRSVYADRALAGDPALAVHHAVRALRERYPQRPDLWATHLHFGP